ncbi:MAG: hypothetical protein ABSB40_12890 [Nitrososphaeria archaeon]|jgi:hypothetical protein
MSDLEAHKKSLELLLDYYEANKYDLCIDLYYINESACNVRREVKSLKQHLDQNHNAVKGAVFNEFVIATLDDLDATIQGIWKKMQYITSGSF